MPLFNYKCEKCGYSIKTFKNLKSTDTSDCNCPKCQNIQMKRNLSTYSFGNFFTKNKKK